MNVDITSSLAIAAPAPAVWDIISDFSRNPEWQKGMDSCVWLTDPPLRVGSRYTQEASFLGRTIRSVFEVTELVAGSTVTIDTVEGTFPITVTRSIDETSEGCVIRAHVRGNPTGLMGLLSPLTTQIVKRSVAADYKRLKAAVEA